MEKAKLQQVVEVLKEQGLTDEQIGKFLEDLTKSSYAKLYTNAVALFTDADLQVIESCQDQNAANNVIKQKYLERTGISAEFATNKFIDDFCIGFLKDYEKSKETAH